MASLGDILRGALGGEYSMGRDLDDEERRRIEELRAQGIHVPQERQSSPFRYGAGTVRKKNLADIRAAMKPDQQRRMNELMFQRGRGARDALAMEQYQQKQQIADAMRKRAIADQGRMRELGGMSTMSPQQRFAADQAKGTGPSMMYRSAEDYAADAPPQITPQEQDELAVLQRENLPSRIQEQTLSTAQQAGRTQELAHQVGLINLEDQRAASQLSAQVREALPADYAQLLANKQVVSTELAVLLDAQRLKTQQKFGDQLAAKSANKQLDALDLELKNIQDTMAWLTQTQQGQVYSMQGGKLGTDYLNVLKQLELALSNARDRENRSRIADRRLTENPPGDSDLENAIPRGLLTVPFVTP
tara:strand:+ start:5109 stop:6191 length:1083 start_codon:yes stop_codon:yes gene_type:complete